jgi:flagellar motor switch protein FliM
MLDNDFNKPLVVKVEGVPKLRATPGICCGNLAFQVYGWIDDSE